MKITKVVIRNFKCFREETFNLDDNVVIAGPNNSGKTTLLQAIASWSLALGRWRELNNYRRSGRGGAYAKAPVTRQAFYPVPLRAFDLLWHERNYRNNRIEIEVTSGAGCIPVEIESDSSEQVYVRPAKRVKPELLRNSDNFPKPVFVPAMTGLGIDEPVYRQPKIDQLLGQGKPGEVLRNLLAEISNDRDAWERLTSSIKSVFGYELLPPNTDGANIIAEYRHDAGGTGFDIAGAGSGFLQVLMLLTFLNNRQGTVLLMDEPDAHLHVILQDGIYSELKATARKSNSQLVIATHSEVVINAVEPRELYALLGRPQKLVDDRARATLIRSLSVLSNTDIMLAREKGRILYVEGHTDLDILRAWAHALNHRIKDFLKQPFWKPAVFETRLQAKGIKAQDHFEALLLVQDEIQGAQITDRDGNEDIPASQKAVDGKLLKLCWTRYEIESYLVHPAALARFVGKAAGRDAPLADVDAMKETMRKYLPGVVVDDPMGEHDSLKTTKARKVVLPPILDETGLYDLPYTRYADIAATMQPEEIHPEIIKILDAVADHFRETPVNSQYARAPRRSQPVEHPAQSADEIKTG